jgi:hypothetical protein
VVDLWLFRGLASVCWCVSSGVWEPETFLFDCKNVDETWLFVWFLWTFWWWFWKLVAERCGRKADFSAPPFTMRPVNGSGRNDGSLVVWKNENAGWRTVYIPPFAKCAKDGAPGVLWWVRGKAWTWWCWQFTSHPSQVREGWGTRAFVVG